MIETDDDNYRDRDYEHSDKEVRGLLRVLGVACIVAAGCYYEFGPILRGLIFLAGAALGARFLYLGIWGSEEACRSTYDFVWYFGRPKRTHWLRR